MHNLHPLNILDKVVKYLLILCCTFQPLINLSLRQKYKCLDSWTWEYQYETVLGHGSKSSFTMICHVIVPIPSSPLSSRSNRTCGAIQPKFLQADFVNLFQRKSRPVVRSFYQCIQWKANSASKDGGVHEVSGSDVSYYHILRILIASIPRSYCSFASYTSFYQSNGCHLGTPFPCSFINACLCRNHPYLEKSWEKVGEREKPHVIVR